jgi:hypothetical protein
MVRFRAPVLVGALQLNFMRYTAAIRVRQSRIELEAPNDAQPILHCAQSELIA